MKTSRAFTLAAAALVIGFAAAHWCVAQSPQPATGQETDSYDFGVLQQLASFQSYLKANNDTNTLRRFDDYSTASLALQHCGDMSMTLILLQELRAGHTNQVYKLLESQLNADIVAFASSYRRLPVSVQSQSNLTILAQARDYRAKHPPSDHYQIIDDAVANAFKILDAPTTK